ncbi:MAG: Uma2 family endonuclease [Spirochaetaceae bacterium]|nr:Uma2 family endonuclease [Spirochaetaceae bacterium]
MAATETASETRPVRHADGTAVRPCAVPDSPAFPGCTPVHLPRAELEHFDRRLEYWEAATETAWVCEPATSYHERPSRLLPQLAVLIAKVRGSRIECYGSMDLLLRDEHGEPQLIMQADESLYLYPDRAKLPGAAVVVGEDDVPDVVLEVDHTTDARRGKLSLYESWGFPEVWVDVPDAPSPNRPRGLRPGLTIHLLEDGCYRVAVESHAFPGWTADEIHAALNEPEPSARTSAVLERVGGALGAREGTGPDDDPLLRSQRRAGFERGRAQGREEGRAEARAAMVRRILRSRGIEVSEGFPAGAAAFAAASEDALLSAAFACADQAEFLAALARADR